MAGLPSGSPDITQMLQGMGGGGSGGGVTHFMAGMGFNQFASTIAKLHGLAGGNKTAENVNTGMTSQPSMPAPPRPPISPPNSAAPSASPTRNPLSIIGQLLPLLKAGQGAPAATAAAPAAAAAPSAMTPPDIMTLLGLA